MVTTTRRRAWADESQAAGTPSGSPTEVAGAPALGPPGTVFPGVLAVNQNGSRTDMGCQHHRCQLNLCPMTQASQKYVLI